MTMTDPIADLLTRIRNVNKLGRRKCSIPYSRMKERILEALQREGFIEAYAAEGEGVERALVVKLKYGPNRERIITRIERVSTPGRRVYKGVEELTPVLRGMGVHVMSTSKGILTDREARSQQVGGEILCRVY